MNEQVRAWLVYAGSQGCNNLGQTWNLYMEMDDSEVLSALTDITGEDPEDAVAYITKFHNDLAEFVANQDTEAKLTDVQTT